MTKDKKERVLKSQLILMFLLDKAKSFVVIYLHYNSDIIFWTSKKKEILRGSQPKFLQRKSAGGIKKSLKKSIRFHNFII